MSVGPASWDDLRLFLAVTRVGSFTRAAGVTGLHHATLIRRIDALEREVGARLLERSAQGVRPTPAGLELADGAARVEAEVASLSRAVAGQDAALEGTVRFTLPASLEQLMMPLLAEFTLAYPAIALDLDLSDPTRDLARREADVALRPTSRAPDDALAKEIGPLCFAPYAPVDADPATAPWLGFGDPLAHLSAAQWLAASPFAPRVRHRVSTVPGLVAAAAEGLGCALLPCYEGDAEPRLRRLGPVVPEAGARLFLLVHVDLRKVARVRALVDHLFPRLLALRDRFAG